MIIFSLAFLLGDLLLLAQPFLPSHYLLLLALSVIALICITLISSSRSLLYVMILGILTGFAYTSIYKANALSWELPQKWEGVLLSARGVVKSIPTEDQFGQHFVFQVQQLSDDKVVIKHQADIHLSWNTNKKIKPGDVFLLQIKIKRIHGLNNPGGFNYATWALQNHLRASGTVVGGAPQRFLYHDYLFSPLNQLRQCLKFKIAHILPVSDTSNWLLALMLGEREQEPASQWDVLRATGTNHLMAIAGLHIGLTAGFVYAMVNWLWRRSRQLVLLYPAPLAASWASLIIAWCYSALAGFSLPTQRACIMLTIFLGAKIARRSLPAWHALVVAMLVVLLLNPLSLLSESFWLSFTTIALIIFGMQGRVATSGWWWHWGRVQAVICFGLLPLSLWFFQQSSLISLIANSIAIPWLGFLILPFCLLALLFLCWSSAISGLMLVIADKSLHWLWLILTWFSGLHFAVWTAPINSFLLLAVTMTGCLILLLPRGTPGKLLGVIWLAPLIFYQAPVPRSNQFWLTVLEVGQGLSLVVQTQHHQLIYDAGPKFGTQLDMGDSVVVPFLRYSGIKNLDMMVISHGDNDHVGGAAAVIKQIPVYQIFTSAPEKINANNVTLCTAGISWNWDGVKFAFLYPYANAQSLGNDSSCVLKITNGKQSILLTGDIEKFAENKLLSNAQNDLSANILIAAHHGSKTSSQLAFIRAVHPQYVIYSTGYLNRYHFPHPAVTSRYADEKIFQLNTVNTGAIRFELGTKNLIPKKL